MRMIGMLTLLSAALFLTTGCGSSRPDPRENPDFDEEGYNDANIMPGDLMEP